MNGCDRPHEARGYCNAHYKRFRDGRGMETPVREMGVPFWGRVDQAGGLDSCWEWTGARHPLGYGRYRDPERGEVVAASRYAAEAAYGPLGERHALHACDNPPCCNPLHLFPGTHLENVRDMDRKGRCRRRKR